MNKKIVFAGGCFWGLEDLIRTQPGVVTTEVGYTGGENENPTYENHPGHAEAVEIEYDPTTLNQQGNDRGTSYRLAVFYNDEEEKKDGKSLDQVLGEAHIDDVAAIRGRESIAVGALDVVSLLPD